MNSKFTIDSTTDGSAKLHEAIAGSCIVDVLVDGVPIEEADLSSDFRSVTLKMDSEAMEDGTVIQSTYGVMCFKVKALFSDENYWVDRQGNIRSNIELTQCIRDQFKSRGNLYVAVSPDVIKKIS